MPIRERKLKLFILKVLLTLLRDFIETTLYSISKDEAKKGLAMNPQSKKGNLYFHS
jgi:hypothetical protein